MPMLGPNVASLQAKRDVAGLVQALKFKDIRTRCVALHALGDLRDPHALPVLHDWLFASTSQTPEKTEVAEALGKIGDARALPDLEVLLRSESRSLARDAKQCVIAIRQRWNLPTIMGF